MKALSIRQPWAWLIVNGHKDIENRTWPTKYRGRVLIHASKGMTRAEYDDVEYFLDSSAIDVSLPWQDKLQRGGIVGVATLIDCIPSAKRKSQWHMGGQFGFRLVEAKPIPFVKCNGALGIFNVSADVSMELRQMHELGAIA